MSASEKLKALNGRTYRTVPVDGTEQMLVAHEDVLWEALPQIVAVVEAAEKAVKDEQYGIQRTPIPAALAALEEALK